MTDCDHANSTGIGTGNYVVFGGETYRVEKSVCDDCGERYYEVYHRVSVDSEAIAPRGAIARHRDGWTDTE